MAVLIGQTLTASLWNASIGNASPHAEWTATSASVASATLASTGTLALDAAPTNTTGLTLATISTNTLTLAADGLYDLDFFGSLPVAPTGVTSFQVSDGTNAFKLSMPVTGSGQYGGSLAAAWRWPAGTVLTFQFYHTSAANRVLTTRLALTKVGTY